MATAAQLVAGCDAAIRSSLASKASSSSHNITACLLEVRITHPETESTLVCEHNKPAARHRRRGLHALPNTRRPARAMLGAARAPMAQPQAHGPAVDAHRRADAECREQCARRANQSRQWPLCQSPKHGASNSLPVFLAHHAGAWLDPQPRLNKWMDTLANAQDPRGVLLGVWDEYMRANAASHLHPIVRGHSMAKSFTTIHQAYGVRKRVPAPPSGGRCDEQGSVFHIHPIGQRRNDPSLPRVQSRFAEPASSSSSASSSFSLTATIAREPAADACLARASKSCENAASLRLLVGVVSHGRGLMRRGVPILRTWGRTMPTHVLIEHSNVAIDSLRSAGCTRWNTSSVVDDEHLNETRWSCHHAASYGTLDNEAPPPLLWQPKHPHESHALLIKGCEGTERQGCCRVTRWLMASVLPNRLTSPNTPLHFDWLLIVDDDVFVRPDIKCVLQHFIPSKPLFLPAKHAHNVTMTKGCEDELSTVGRKNLTHLRDCHTISLCGEAGPLYKRTTRLALPAGYGALSSGFVELLAQPHFVERLKEQCTQSMWFYDLAIAFSSWALGVDLSPALDWTWRNTNSWLGGQRYLWSDGSVINHKVNGEYDHVELLHQCADRDGGGGGGNGGGNGRRRRQKSLVTAPLRSPETDLLMPFVRMKVPQTAYAELIRNATAVLEGRRDGRPYRIPSLTASEGPLWSCNWALIATGGFERVPQRQPPTRKYTKQQQRAASAAKLRKILGR